MHGSKLSKFIQSDVPSNALLLMANEFGTVFESGVQRLETLELEIQYLQALAKPERETSSHNTLLEVLNNVSRLASHICLPVFYRFFIAAVRSIET